VTRQVELLGEVKLLDHLNMEVNEPLFNGLSAFKRLGLLMLPLGVPTKVSKVEHHDPIVLSHHA
jgi:hypothetical protein